MERIGVKDILMEVGCYGGMMDGWGNPLDSIFRPGGAVSQGH